MSAVLILPIKSFTAAKARLAPVLSAGQRAELARWTAGRVLDAGRGMERVVVCDDDDVADWATGRGATVLWMPGRGLNGAVDAAVGQVTAAGATQALVAHGDLPLAAGIATIRSHTGFTLVADRFGDGTNVLSMPTATPIAAAYGVGSFRRHLAAALATGVAVTVRSDRHLALDLDRPADLRHPLLTATPLAAMISAWNSEQPH